jgi:hypothetical protein
MACAHRPTRRRRRRTPGRTPITPPQEGIGRGVAHVRGAGRRGSGEGAGTIVRGASTTAGAKCCAAASEAAESPVDCRRTVSISEKKLMMSESVVSAVQGVTPSGNFLCPPPGPRRSVGSAPSEGRLGTSQKFSSLDRALATIAMATDARIAGIEPVRGRFPASDCSMSEIAGAVAAAAAHGCHNHGADDVIGATPRVNGPVSPPIDG